MTAITWNDASPELAALRDERRRLLDLASEVLEKFCPYVGPGGTADWQARVKGAQYQDWRERAGLEPPEPRTGGEPRLPLPAGAEFEALYAPGRRVRFAHTDCGWPGEAEDAAAHLTLGEVYTIAWSDIGFTKSRLGLEGVTQDRSQGFNSVFFEPVPAEKLSEEEEPQP